MSSRSIPRQSGITKHRSNARHRAGMALAPFAASLVIALVAGASSAEACQCGPRPSVEAAAAGAEVVFVATPQAKDDGGGAFLVRRVFKGSVPAQVTVHQSDCASVIDGLVHRTEASQRGDVLVYGYRGGDRLFPMMCGRTAFVVDAAACE